MSIPCNGRRSFGLGGHDFQLQIVELRSYLVGMDHPVPTDHNSMLGKIGNCSQRKDCEEDQSQ